MNKSEIAERAAREKFEKLANGWKLPLKRNRILYSEYITQIAWMAYQAGGRAIADSEPGICPTCKEELRCANEGCGIPLADHFDGGFCNEQTDYQFQSPLNN